MVFFRYFIFGELKLNTVLSGMYCRKCKYKGWYLTVVPIVYFGAIRGLPVFRRCMECGNDKTWDELPEHIKKSTEQFGVSINATFGTKSIILIK